MDMKDDPLEVLRSWGLEIDDPQMSVRLPEVGMQEEEPGEELALSE